MKINELMQLPYRVSLYPLSEDDGGGWFAEVPDLPGCGSDGETEAEALDNLKDAKREWLLAAIETGRQIPKPTSTRHEYSGRILVRAPKSLHRRLVHMAKVQGVSLNQFAVYLLTRGVETEQQAIATDTSGRRKWQSFTSVAARPESFDHILMRMGKTKERIEMR